ncbi:ethanolamine ammonia-lyase subunit EutC [Solimonas marina]|uniref:Ethanolamine ammonia-lyase small subunit n=1 Tax=Solimonas marina TaxID=2714601 RepID=A0A970B508_9GAMM|nr:ethanolamine ammonia-lyase subunit EutC [Solimonas marina]NKF21188.1 ethanolamine ammonia-lyase subunit EutC [Solimonas marina]
MSDAPAESPNDPFARLRIATRARIGLGRAGDALPTRALLDFQAAHSRARDAVHGVVDFDAIAEQLDAQGLRSLRIRSQVTDRASYLRRPDLGRRVYVDDLPTLEAAHGDYDLAFVVADGLSAAAVNAHAAALIGETRARLSTLTLAPVVLAQQARVALGDEVGAVLGARIVALLVGERPGLSVADSLGVYLTWAPRVGRSDAERNCISNIHADGLTYAQAADTLAWLITESRRRQLSGVQLKLDAAPTAVIEAATP